jgi:hypothetical protein
MTAAADPLEDFRWKRRLLVVTASDEALVGKITPELSGMVERDVRIFVLSGPASYGEVPAPALAKELRKRLKVRSDLAEVLLLGKDGSTTLRWKVGEFSVAALFARVDAMPMRQREMRKQRSQ